MYSSCLKLCNKNKALVTLKFIGCSLNDLIDNPTLLDSLIQQGLNTIHDLRLVNVKTVELEMKVG